MRAIAVCGADVPADKVTVLISGKPVNFGLVNVPKPSLNHPNHVLIRVKGFALGYRDQTLILNASDRCQGQDIYVIGSDFVGEIVDVGEQVQDIQVGQRVVGNNHWTGLGPPEGIPTNHASYEYLVLPAEKVMPIPDSLPDSVAAGFSLYAQTAYSLVRRLCITPEHRVLVTAARSNTSLFVLSLLKAQHIQQVYALTTTIDPTFHKMLDDMGVQVLDPNDFSPYKMKFDRVIDPFFDIYLERTVPALAPYGQYITCGLHTQHMQQVRDVPPMNAPAALLYAMMHNISIMGNCLGETSDLQAALNDYENGGFDVPIDCVAHDVKTLIERTYNASDSIGRVVYLYD